MMPSLPGALFAEVFATGERRAERPGFPSRIQRDRHRCSGTERREQEIVGSGTRVRPAEADRLVRQESVAADRDLLGKSRCAPTHHNDTRLHRLVHYTAPCWGWLQKLRRQTPLQVAQPEGPGLGDQLPRVVHLTPGVPEQDAAHAAALEEVDDPLSAP